MVSLSKKEVQVITYNSMYFLIYAQCTYIPNSQNPTKVLKIFFSLLCTYVCQVTMQYERAGACGDR